MKHRALTGLVASSVGLVLTLGFACVDADIPNISNDLRDALEENFANAGAAALGNAGDGGSAATPAAGAGGNGGDEPSPNPSGGAAGSSMAAEAGSGGSDAAGAGGGAPVAGGDCDGFAVLETNCGSSGCHGENGPYGDFAASEEAAAEFIDEEGRLSCAGQGAIINTDDPEASVLVQKMSADPPCGQQMPPTGAALPEEDVACVVEWIGTL